MVGRVPPVAPVKLDSLVSTVPVLAHRGDLEVDVRAVTHDSREVGPGTLFCCIPGRRHDGHDHAPAAVEAGAVAVLCERDVPVEVPRVVVGSVRAAIGPIAAALHGVPSRHVEVVGVTGTDGKSTTVHLLASILDAAGRRPLTLGNLHTSGLNTPEAPTLQAALADAVAGGHGAVAMEVSSIGLAQRRVDGTRFAVGVFTNLSRDHIGEFHESMEDYFRAKARLFDPELSQAAVVNLDDPHGRLLLQAARTPTAGYGLADAADLRLGRSGSTFTWRGAPVELRLVGRFNVANALAAATAAAELGIDTPTIARGLSRATPAPGRLEPIDAGQPFSVLVDYAHTPDGLRTTLRTVRDALDGRLLLVFGAGGDRDRDKRPAMGAAAAALADVLVLTSDNPRSEDPARVLADVRAGVPPSADVHTELDRRAAIARALAAARPGDVVVVAGKGHETAQVFADRTVPFDDRVVVRELLAETHR